MCASMPAPPIHQYIQCPGKDEEHRVDTLLVGHRPASVFKHRRLWRSFCTIPPDPTPMFSYEYPLSSMDAPPMAERFVSVFGREFPHGTWYQQQRAWKYSSQAEQDNAAQLPRTSDGLWSTWRNTSSGWDRVCTEKRR
ncbi:hypothetical protein B0H14DRAFT_3880002 [Mycena olivaceomarginata]|nr:hypothetical protein B0H14DRAFT_3880002 [Mycena olivaceomarginata]